jgi:hypothetical protein
MFDIAPRISITQLSTQGAASYVDKRAHPSTILRAKREDSNGDILDFLQPAGGLQGTSLATPFQMPHGVLSSSRVNDILLGTLRLSCLSCGPVFGNVGKAATTGSACRGKMMVVTFNSFYLLASIIRRSFKPSPRRGSFLCTIIMAIQRQLIR